MRGWLAMFHLQIAILLPLGAEPDKRIIDGVSYRVLRVPASSVRVVWKDGEGAALRTFPAAVRYLEESGETVDTIMNGGIFEPGGIPSGLLIQDGKQWTPVNRRQGKGNFFLQPNGIFLIDAKGASVIRTDEYRGSETGIIHAVQSGPLPLRNGKRHPKFNKASTSRLHRNGVGVAGNGEVVFVMSEFRSDKFPNLFEFAEVFRTLGCEDALFLDGDLSQMRWGERLTKPSNHFGSFIAVVREKE